MLFSGCINNTQTEIFEITDNILISDPITLVDNDDIIIVFISSNQISSTKFEMQFEAQNKSDMLHSFSIHPIMLNETGLYMGYKSHEIEPTIAGSVHQFSLYVDYSIQGFRPNTKEIHTFSFMYTIGTEKNKETNIVSISKGSLYRDTTLSDKYLIGSDEYFDVYFIMARKNENTGREIYSLLLYNKSNKPLYLYLKSFAINDVSLHTNSHLQVQPHSFYYFADSTYGSYESKPFLSKINEVATVEIDFRSYENQNDEITSSIQSKLVLNTDIKLKAPRVEGKVIYDENDIIISVETIRIKHEAINSKLVVLFWNVYNNSDEPCNIDITNFVTSYPKSEEYDDLYTNCVIPFSVLPNTSSRLLSYSLRYPHLDDGKYFMTADYIFYNDTGDEVQKETLTFTVK